MKKIALTFASVATLLMASDWSPAHAIPRSFVSGSGGGAVCSRAAPCATFQAAHDATDPGGEINCVDAGTYGPVTITKSITIDCTGTVGAIDIGPFGIAIDTPGVVVRLRSLVIRGQAGGSTASAGIDFVRGAALFVENCTLTNADTLAGAIFFRPAAGTGAKLFVSDTVVTGIGDSSEGAGIVIGPTVPVSIAAILDRVRMEKSFAGMVVSTSGGVTAAHIRNSVSTGNLHDGIHATSSVGTASVTMDRSSSTLNGGSGVISNGSGAFVLLGRSAIISNVTGLRPLPPGAILSYQNNHASGNVADGAPTGVLTMH